MNKISTIIPALLFTVLLSACGKLNKEADAFRMQKKYWVPDDYENAKSIIESMNLEQSQLPNLSDPQTAPIFNKIIDSSNIAVGAGDAQVGLTTREDFIKNMFETLRDLVHDYSSMDRQDKYKYPVELVDIMAFHLYVQQYYITLGNQKIVKESDNPNDAQTTNLTSRNLQVLVDNYSIYLDHINDEDRFTDGALSLYAKGIGDYFPRVITDIAPNADYSAMSTKIDNMLNKTKNQAITQQLQNLKTLIAKKEKKTP